MKSQIDGFKSLLLIASFQKLLDLLDEILVTYTKIILRKI